MMSSETIDSRRIKVLTAVCGIFAVVVIVISGYALYHQLDDSAHVTKATVTSDNICVTEACVKASSDIIASLDTSVDPCDDFYEYACGGWEKTHLLPSNKVSVTPFYLMADAMRVTVREMLEEPINERDSNATVSAKNFYMACVNETAIEQLGSKPLIDLLGTLGGWPVISSNWSESMSMDWVEVTARLRTLNNQFLIHQTVEAEGKNSSPVITILIGNNWMPSKEQLGEGSLYYQAALKYMVEVANLLGAPLENATKDMQEVLEFERQLLNFTEPEYKPSNYLKINLDQLIVELPEIDWIKYFKIAMPMFKINGSEPIILYSKEYLQHMIEVVSKTSRRTTINHLLWRFIADLNRVHFLGSKLQEKFLEFEKDFYGSESSSDRREICTNYVNWNMGSAMGALFVAKYFDEASKETVLDTIKAIKNSFDELLDENDWMDETTKQVARRKLQLMKTPVGYPDHIYNSTELNDEYKQFDFHPEKHFENVIKRIQLWAAEEQLKLRNTAHKSEWSAFRTQLSAYFTHFENSITFPGALLQEPLFHIGFPKSVNFGGLGGTVIGHEISHAFDQTGSRFEENGNAKEWWTADTKERYEKKSECMVDQYSSYIVPDINMKVNGKMTLSENIADNVGLHVAFRAYRKWESTTGSKPGFAEPLLPGLKLNHHQLFFISYAKQHCELMRPVTAIDLTRTYDHSLGRFGVIGALSNSEEFARAFQCLKGSRMNPELKCSIW